MPTQRRPQPFEQGRYGGDNPERPTPFQPSESKLDAFAQQARAQERQTVTSETVPYSSEGRQDAPMIEQSMGTDQPPRNSNPIGLDQIRNAMQTLQKYKQGKQNLEDKITRNEKWWKLRHWDLIETESTRTDPKPASGWLFNTIISKHADFMDNFPDPVVLPREPGDVQEAQILSSIIPVILDQNGFRDVYSAEAWYKLKHGTGVFGVFWDASKLNGLGDITVQDVDILSLFWEPGVKDIQKSRNLFYVELVDREVLEEQYPQVRGNLRSINDDTILKRYMNDESIDTTNKVLVIDWYYKKNINGKQTLQFCKFCDEIILYATENEAQQDTVEQDIAGPDGSPVPVSTTVPSIAETGLYDHGMYPFIFDQLFPETDMPCGFGFVDVCKNPQTSIDIYNNAFEKNVCFGATPRWFKRGDGGINTEEFMDPNIPFITVDGNLGEDDIRAMDPPTPITSAYLELYNAKIDEMKETAGNRDVSNGGSTSGATAASAIAAMQESSGKTSRDQIATTYSAYKKMISMVIELIRQFYDIPRQFRIVGKRGQEQFTTFSNEGLQPQYQGEAFGEDLGYRLPVFDVDVEAEKQSAYSRLSQNELALSFYNAGFFNPQMTDQALACLEMMDFEGRDSVMDRIRQNGGMYEQMLNMQQQMLQLAQMVDQLSGGQYGLAPQISDEINQNLDQAQAQGMGGGTASMSGPTESGITRNARERAAQTTSPV